MDSRCWLLSTFLTRVSEDLPIYFSFGCELGVGVAGVYLALADTRFPKWLYQVTLPEATCGVHVALRPGVLPVFVTLANLVEV